MPSHFANWMREEKSKIKAHHKHIDDMLKRDDLGTTVNYDLNNIKSPKEDESCQSQAITENLAKNETSKMNESLKNPSEAD